MKKHVYLIYFVMLSGLASLLNYITYPVLARILSDNQFVNMTVVLSLLTQMSFFLLSIVALTTGLTKDKNSGASTDTIERLQAVLIRVFMIIVVGFVVSSPFFLDKLKVPFIYTIPICLLMLFSIPTSIISGFLNGKGKLIKLGMVAFLTAILQFIFAVSEGVVSRNGAMTLIAMAFGQLMSLAVINWLYRVEHLPRISTIFHQKIIKGASIPIRWLVRYTILSSLGIMAINLLQIVDLLLIKSRQVDAKLYTDLYIISRVVFFAGTIFIWPFLSSINIYKHRQNIIPFAKVSAVIVFLSLGAVVGIALFGQQITSILFGSHYALDSIRQLGILAIAYKFTFLMLTAITLYFIVLRSYWAIILPVILAVITILFMVSLRPSDSSIHILYGLNIVGAIGLVTSLVVFIHTLGFRSADEPIKL